MRDQKYICTGSYNYKGRCCLAFFIGAILNKLTKCNIWGGGKIDSSLKSNDGLVCQEESQPLEGKKLLGGV